MGSPALFCATSSGAAFSFVFGAILGSFFNVIIARFPNRESIIFPGSHCRNCAKPIEWRDNIPLLSWIILRGRCRHCNTSISVQYPFVELGTALLCLGLYLSYLRWALPFQTTLGIAYLALISIPVVIIDAKYKEIPTYLIYPGLLIAFVYSLLPGEGSPLSFFVGAGVPALSLWILGYLSEKILKKEAMGLGDVRLIGMIGGFFGVLQTFNALFLAAFLGILFSLVSLWLKKWSLEDKIPFGPYLCAGGLLSHWIHFPLFL